MECVEAALKTSIRKEMAFRTSPQLMFDEFSSHPNAQIGCSSDDFFVDDLLDFSNEEVLVEEEEHEHQQQEPHEEQQQEPQRNTDTDKDNNNVVENSDTNSNSNKSKNEDSTFACLPTSELCLPAEDLESLEWLSHFVEDSFASFPAAGTLTVKPELRHEQAAPPSPEKPCFKTPVPAKARSKRTRTGGRVWSLGSPTFTESSSSSSSSSSSQSPTSPLLIFTNVSSIVEPVEKSAAKKQRKKPAVQANPVQPRRCSHCGVQKTPQWRTGPLGAKTLCNACGVRYKSGRLLPEYRPACSPTFSSELHSNHHRKVLEMRRKKEVEMAGTTPSAQMEGEVAQPAVAGF